VSPRRKYDSVSLATMSCGRLFHSRAPATINDNPRHTLSYVLSCLYRDVFFAHY